MRAEYIYTPYVMNYMFFIIGMLIVWLSTRSWIAMLGALIASFHLSIKAKDLTND